MNNRNNSIFQYFSLLLLIFGITTSPGHSFTRQVDLKNGSDADIAYQLNAGFNLINIPLNQFTGAFSLLSQLGNNDQITKIQKFDPISGKFQTASYDATGFFKGEDFSILSGDALIIYSKTNHMVTLEGLVNCPELVLSKGTQYKGFPCTNENISAFELLKGIRVENSVANIQRFNAKTGRFETVVLFDNTPSGIDFPIRVAEGYIVNMENSPALLPFNFSGTFWLHGEPIFNPLGVPISSDSNPDSILIVGNLVSISSGSSATRAEVTANDTEIRLVATWKECMGVNDVVLKVVIDKATGNNLSGIVDLGNVDIPILASKTFGESLRIATYNVQMLPSQFSAATTSTRARKITDRIIAAGYDFIVLNEVFDEDVRDEVFVHELKSIFKYHVDYLSGGTVPHEDSGLMLFSRFPFDDLPVTTYQVNNPTNPLLNTGLCRGTDCTKAAIVNANVNHLHKIKTLYSMS